MGRRYRIGTRRSPLALRQVDEIMEMLSRFYGRVEHEIIGIDTCGDMDRETPISGIEGSDFFTKEIDRALLAGEIDFAVHSAKDLPDSLPNGLFFAALTDSIDRQDVLVSKSGRGLKELPFGARVGTSSVRRKEALKRFRPDFDIVDIRGNVEERLRMQGLDAVVVAAAGLIRLGLEHRITERIPFDILEPHPLQGKLAVVTRKKDGDVKSLFSRRRPRKA